VISTGVSVTIFRLFVIGDSSIVTEVGRVVSEGGVLPTSKDGLGRRRIGSFPAVLNYPGRFYKNK